MNIFIYDFEVFRFNWLVVFLDIQSMEFTVIHNDSEALQEFLQDDGVYIGFNSKNYDQFIMKACACGFENEEVKALNDFLIKGGRGWDYPPLEYCYFKFNNVDIMDDMQMGLSLKAIEGHLGMNIQETEVDFNLDRPLTQEELEQTIYYCKHDVEATWEVVKLRKGYLQTKMDIGKLAGLPAVKALSMTNAKLTAALLKAKSQPHDDERQYVYPENLKREYIPQEVFDFFDRMYDPEISDKDLFKGKLKFNIGDCPVTMGYGGIHAAIPNYVWEGEYEDI